MLPAAARCCGGGHAAPAFAVTATPDGAMATGEVGCPASAMAAATTGAVG